MCLLSRLDKCFLDYGCRRRGLFGDDTMLAEDVIPRRRVSTVPSYSLPWLTILYQHQDCRWVHSLACPYCRLLHWESLEPGHRADASLIARSLWRYGLSPGPRQGCNIIVGFSPIKQRARYRTPYSTYHIQNLSSLRTPIAYEVTGNGRSDRIDCFGRSNYNQCLIRASHTPFDFHAYSSEPQGSEPQAFPLPRPLPRTWATARKTRMPIRRSSRWTELLSSKKVRDPPSAVSQPTK